MIESKFGERERERERWKEELAVLIEERVLVRRRQRVGNRKMRK